MRSYFPTGVGGIFSAAPRGSLHESSHLLASDDDDYGDTEMGRMGASVLHASSDGGGGYYDEDDDDDVANPPGAPGLSGSAELGFAELEMRRLREQNLSASMELARLQAENERYRAAAAATSVPSSHEEL